LDAKPHLHGSIAFLKAPKKNVSLPLFVATQCQGSNKKSRLFDSNQTGDVLPSLAMGGRLSITCPQLDPKKRLNLSKLALQQLSADASGETGWGFHCHQTG
jgi:hypothetical protein